MKTYKIDQVEVAYKKEKGKYVADFFVTGTLLEIIPDVTKYWGLKFNRVKDVKNFADELSIGKLHAK